MQLEAIKLFCSQIEKAGDEKKNIIIQGDANLCALKWLEADYNLGYLADELLGTLSLCGLENVELGNTYLADRLTDEGMTIESALDHTYLSAELKKSTKVNKLDTSSTDHLPIVANTYIHTY